MGCKQNFMFEVPMQVDQKALAQICNSKNGNKNRTVEI